MQNVHPSLAFDRLNRLQRSVVGVLLKTPESVRQYDILDQLQPGAPSQATLSRALSSLSDAGLVLKTGQTKSARFALTPSARYWWTDPVARRPVSFDLKRFTDYVPNETRWLPESARAKMVAAVRGHASLHLDASTYSRQISERFLIDLSWASSALEGNTYSRLDTEVLIKYGQAAEGRDSQEATMILSHKRAILLLLERVESTDLTDLLIKQVHGSLMRGLLDTAALGRVRTGRVRVSGTAYRPSSSPTDLAIALSTLAWNTEHTQDPWEAMFVLTAGLSYLQAFEDGNKRLGRLMGNLPLLRAGLPPMSFIGMDKKPYIQGLLAFYEQGDASLLAEVLADGYEKSAPSYEGAVSTGRLPHRIESREPRRLEEAIRLCVDAVRAHRSGDREEWSEPARAAVQPVDRPAFMEALNDILDSLVPENALAWGIPDDVFAEYRKALTPASPVPSPQPRIGRRP